MQPYNRAYQEGRSFSLARTPWQWNFPVFNCLVKEVRQSRWGFRIRLAENYLIWNVYFRTQTQALQVIIEKYIYFISHLQELLSKELENSGMLPINENHNTVVIILTSV